IKLRDRTCSCVIENGTVNLFLVPKVVVDGRHIRLRLLADFANGGLAEAMFGEHLTCRLQQPLPGFGGFICAIHTHTTVSNTTLKHPFHMSNDHFNVILNWLPLRIHSILANATGPGTQLKPPAALKSASQATFASYSHAAAELSLNHWIPNAVQRSTTPHYC